MQTEYDVVVVGLGPAGTLFSLLLNDSSIRILGIDKDREIYNLPRAVNIDDEGLRIMQRLNLEHIYLDNSTVISGAYFVDDKLQKLSGMDIPKDFLTGNGWPPGAMFHQPYTDELLREELLKTDCTIHLETELTEIIDKNDYYIVKTKNLSTLKENSVSTKYIIGADGASSKVRSILGIAQEDLDYDKNWLVVDVKLNQDNNLPGYAAQICDPKRISTYIPAHLPYRRWEFILLEGETKEEMLKKDKIQELISPWIESDGYQIIRAAVYRFHSLLTDKFRHGNCFLIGDAAHQNPPFMGQGMMSGYRDALNLSWKLTAVIQKLLSENILETYEKERKPHSRFVVEGSAAIGKLMSAYSDAVKRGNSSDVPQELLDKGYGSYSLPPLDDGILYKGKSDNKRMVGFHFPQPLLMEGSKCKERYDHILGKRFCVVSKEKVALTPDQKDFYKKIKTKFLVLEESMINNNPWIKEFMVNSKTYIIRPDRHIFGSTSDKITFSELTRDFKERLRM